LKRFFQSLKHVLGLSWRIFSRTIGAKYRKSFLGYFWMVAPAIFITLGVSIANRAGIIKPGETLLPYPLFALIGTLIWHVFSEAVEVPHQAFEGARSYLTRVYFSREAIILAQLYEALITTLVRALLVLASTAFVVGLSPMSALLIVAGFFGTVFLGVGIGCFLMPFTLLFSDLRNSVKIILSYGLFFTPAMYQPEGTGLFASFVRNTPVSPIMTSSREAAAGVLQSGLPTFISILVLGLILSAAGFVVVRMVAPIVIERMLLGGK
jgi:lipopolysaccharide transport system permease protein